MPAMYATAELLSATFKARVASSSDLERGDPPERIDGDFFLVVRTPGGTAEWSFGWSHQDLDVAGLAAGKSPRVVYDGQMRTMFEDHLYDLREAGFVPDRGFDDLPVEIEIPDEVIAAARRRLG